MNCHVKVFFILLGAISGVVAAAAIFAFLLEWMWRQKPWMPLVLLGGLVLVLLAALAYLAPCGVL